MLLGNGTDRGQAFQENLRGHDGAPVHHAFLEGFQNLGKPQKSV
jgi:hypothetical protein